MKHRLKIIGTVGLQETSKFLTSSPWEPMTKNDPPYSIVTKPKGFLCAYGSTCASMPTTSLQGHTFVEDTYIFRQDGTAVDVDRYLGSVTPDNTLAVLKVPSNQISFHHLEVSDEIIKALPMNEQKKILDILGTKK